MKEFFQRIAKTLSQASLPERVQSALEMPESPARRQALRALFSEIQQLLPPPAASAEETAASSPEASTVPDRAPHLVQTHRLALDIARALLSGKPSVEELEEVDRFCATIGSGSRRELDRKVAEAAARASDGKAFSLLLRIGERHTADSQIQAQVGKALLKKQELGFDLIQKLGCSVPFFSAEDRTAATRVIAPLLDVDLDAGEAEIREAEAVASQFSRSSEYLSGVARVLGIGALRLHGEPDIAAHHFEVALSLDADDTRAREGLRRALLESGQFGALGSVTADGETNWGVLQSALAWLEGDGDSPNPPVSADGLARERVPEAAAWNRDFAVARLHLIEGDSVAATRLLQDVAARDPESGRVSYYACWAELLSSGSKAQLENRLHEYEDWEGAWTLLSRVWDADPSGGEALRGSVLAGADPDFAALMRTRCALALDEELEPAPTRSSSCLEEEIEALRTRLGQACVRRDLAGVNTRMENPLFRLLPKADRLFWEGMSNGLRNDPEGARINFEEASALGHRRASWAIGVLYAQRGQIDQAADWSNKGLVDRHDDRARFWRRWLAAAGGDGSAQADIGSGVQAEPRGALAAAYFSVARADAAQRGGKLEEATRLVERAFASFRAVRANSPTFADASLMAACLQFWLNPQRGAPVLSSFWPQVEAMPHSPRRSWLLWLVILAKIARNDPRNVPEAAAALRRLLFEAGTLPDSVRGALVRSLAGAIQSEQDEQAESREDWLEVLKQFPGSALEGERQLAVAAAAWRRCGVSTTPDPDFAQAIKSDSEADPANGLLALVAAFANLRVGKAEVAGRVLHRSAATTNTVWLQHVARAIAPEPADVHQSATETKLADSPLFDLSLATGLLLQALTAFDGGMRDPGFDFILRAWRLKPDRVPGIFKVSQWIAVVCAGSVGNAPPQLLATVKELAGAASQPAELDRLAHCAAVLNSPALARELWIRAVECSSTGTGFDRADFARYLCHMAAIEAKAARSERAFVLVREASGHLPATTGGAA